jgi:hypothetical protein
MSRFYGKKLPNIKEKVNHCGVGQFDIFVVVDKNPIFSVVDTSSGPQYVNKNLFEDKATFRQLSGGGHKVHITNSPDEYMRDMTLLLGPNFCEVLKDVEDGEILKTDLIGANGWNSLSEVFAVLNSSMSYLVLRNYDVLPDVDSFDAHGDIDLLVDDLNECIQVLNATKVHKLKYRRHYSIQVSDQKVYFDLRTISDRYYDPKWAGRMLISRQEHRGFFIPNDLDNYFSLLYHALVHKRKIAEDYIQKFNQLRNENIAILAPYMVTSKLESELDKFMMTNGYQYTRPDDASVNFNEYFVNKDRFSDTSIKNQPPIIKRIKRKGYPIYQYLKKITPQRVKFIVKNLSSR